MLTKITKCSVVLLVLASLTVPATAHHSGSMFDETKPMTLKGVVKSFDWVNPHSRILLVVDAGSVGAGRTWMIETTSPGRLTREGWTKRSLKPGDHIEAKIAPAVSGDPIGNMIEVKNLDTGEALGRAR